jgi:hypothetical protein
VRAGWKRERLLAAVLAAAAAILAYQLFIPPIVGLADQGDFVRTIGRFGWGPQHHGSLLYVYVEPKYIPDPHYRSPAWEQANSEYLFVGTALLVNRVVSKDGTLDIKMAGLIHTLALLLALARLLWVTRHERARAVLWIGALVALTDAGYAVYLNSWYAEPASCVFLLLLLAEGTAIGRAGVATWGNLLCWSVWGFLWVFAKPQNAPIGLLLSLFTLRLMWWTSSIAPRALAVAGACAMFGCAVYNIAAMPWVGHMANTYGMIFNGILLESKDPAADLRALGLDPNLARYSGSGAWTPNTDFPELAKSAVLQRQVSTFTILRFYLLRPARFWRRLHGVLPQITFLRKPWYGNFEPSAGLPPAAQSQAFNLWSGLHERILPAVNKWLVFVLACCPLAAVWRWWRAGNAAERRRLELVTLLPVLCLTALLGAVFGDAFDLIKHMFLFNLLLDACLLYAAAAGWNWLASRRPQH